MIKSDIFKYFVGTLDDFKSYLANLFVTDKEKYMKLKSCIVYIHPQDPEDSDGDVSKLNKKTVDGWMYSHGNFYSMKSINTNIDITGGTYVTVTSEGNTFKIDLNSDMILNSDEYPELTKLVTEGYLKQTLSFETVK